MASSNGIVSRSEYCSIEATSCKYLSGTESSNFLTSFPSSSVDPRLLYLDTMPDNFPANSSIDPPSFIFILSNSLVSVCSLAF
ncbi:hypothetical protein HanRHA438_Chr01g0012751 [Helianthus annuus]|nr:hypothetical protein HanRHA438_Chr01g0012751 [Helianthus annuus]